VSELAVILPKAKIKGRLYADKGYASKENKAALNGCCIKNGVMEKAQKN